MNILEKILLNRRFRFRPYDHSKLFDPTFTCYYSVLKVVGKTIHLQMEDIKSDRIVRDFDYYVYVRAHHSPEFDEVTCKDVFTQIRKYLTSPVHQSYVTIHNWKES